MIATGTRRNRFGAGISRTALASMIGLALCSTAPVTALAAGHGARHEDAGTLVKAALPNYDFNGARAVQGLRVASAAQLKALDTLKTSSGATAMYARWNDFGGSPDVIYDFVSPAYAGTPEAAARAFIADNAALFGVPDAGAANLKLFSSVDALGGRLLRFQQLHRGILVDGGGIGIVMNGRNQVVMASGPFFRDVQVNTTPTLSAAQAVSAAAAALGKLQVALPAEIVQLQEVGLAVLSQQVQPQIAKIPPTLWVYPTADGYRLAWKVANYSTNPFGLFEIAVDAHSGQILARKDHVASLGPVFASPGQETADIFPTSPLIDANLKENRRISTCTTDGRQHPCGQERIRLRAFDPSNRVTGLSGTLTGPNVIATNALASKLPFGQAPFGTWHFSKDDPIALEAATNEASQYAEPAEHQDEINAFFFVNYNKEYVDYLHVAGDSGAAFPDSYQNKGVPTLANAHIPNIYIALNAVLCGIAGTENPDPGAILTCVQSSLPKADDPDLVDKVLSLDNAFALQTTGIYALVTGEQPAVAVNPTSYGHGFFFNDLALDGMVAYHEVMHSTSTPIAGLEGFEGGSLNEGQADTWAYTLADYPNIGEYVVQAKGYRDRLRGRGQDPDKLGWIRSARSTLKYGDFLRQGDGEVHWGGEIYAATKWDLREMFNRQYPQSTQHKRPSFKDGQPTRAISEGTEIFERNYLATMYILGTMNPDTFVKARDAFIVADTMLYPSGSEAGARGRHRAMIEQVFAAHELGINAKESGGANSSVTISTQVTQFAGTQTAPAVPANVAWVPASATSLKVSWTGVPGAVAYEVLKRNTASVGKREVNGPFVDGDAATTGFRHVAYVAGNQTSYVDQGKTESLWLPAGLASLSGSEYVLRAIGPNASGQLGWSALSQGQSGSQPGDGWSAAPVASAYFDQAHTGSLAGATVGTLAPVAGVTYQDFPVEAKSDVQRLEATLSAGAGSNLSMNLQLRSEGGQVLQTVDAHSASAVLSAVLQPGAKYTLRVNTSVNPIVNYTLKARQVLPAGSPNANTGG